MINGKQVNKHSIDKTSTTDDEYTPSVFQTFEYYFQKGLPSPGFLQWKPISYQSRHRKSTESQQANYVPPSGSAIDLLNGTIPSSLASALFNDSIPLNGTVMYIVFGTSGDETYLNSKYQTWYVHTMQ